MIVHTPARDTVLIDFFVEAPGREGTERGEELVPIDVHFDESTTQVFNVGAASCGVPGTAAGLAAALERFGTMPMEALIGPAVRYAREGAPINRQQAFVLSILAPIYTRLPECREIYAPEGRILGEGDAFRFPDLAERAGAVRRRGAGALLRGGDRPRRRRLRLRAGRHPLALRHGRLPRRSSAGPSAPPTAAARS